MANAVAQRRLGKLAAGQERFGRIQTGMAPSTDPAPRPPAPRPALFYDRIPPDSGVALSHRTHTILTYALSSFANFGSIAPERLPGKRRHNQSVIIPTV